MKKFTISILVIVALASMNSLRAYHHDDAVQASYEVDERGNYIPVITPVAEGTQGVLEGTGQVLKGAGEIVTLQPGQGVHDVAEGTANVVESAVMTPFNILSGN